MAKIIDMLDRCAWRLYLFLPLFLLLKILDTITTINEIVFWLIFFLIVFSSMFVADSIKAIYDKQLEIHLDKTE
jgi:hypothetical protein